MNKLSNGTFFIPHPSPSKSPALSSIKVKVNNKDGAEIIYVPAGEFLMGSRKGQGSNDEQPQHRVYLNGYRIYKNEVTNEQFARFVSATGYRAEGDWKVKAKSGRNLHPVVNVSWNDAEKYCKWAGGRLPTEAEWEKAARGKDGRVYPWGNTWERNRCNWLQSPKVPGMTDSSGSSGTAPVGSFPKGVSPYGLHDMAGNVME